MIKRQASYIALGLFFIDAAILVLCFFGAFYAKKYIVLPDHLLDMNNYKDLIILEIPFVLMVLFSNGLYFSRNLLSGLKLQIVVIGKGTIQVFAVFVIVSFYAKLFSYSRAVFTLFFILMPIGLISTRILLLTILNLFGNFSGMVQKVLIFGSSEMTEGLLAKLKKSSIYQFDVIGIADDGELKIENAVKLIEQGKVDCIIIDLSLAEHEKISEIIKKAEIEGISIFMTPRILPSSFLNLSRVTIAGVQLISLLPPDIPLMGGIIKKIIDYLFALILIIVISPLLALIAVLIKLTSKGPIIFKQTRIGYDGKNFTIYKFRTMYFEPKPDKTPVSVWTKQNDERVTKLGSILRKTNLDEIPQLFNVLNGTMSLVGPRPERPDLVKQFKGEIGRYAHKHWVKPGMTGWAQVNGYRGDTSLEKRIEYDIYYIEHWSIWLDIKILLMTPFYGFRNAM